MVFHLDLVAAVSGAIIPFCRDTMTFSRYAVTTFINELVKIDGGILSNVLGNIHDGHV